MTFEFDSDKSASNQQKHGIDFCRAQALWDDPGLIEILAKTEDKPSYLVVGKIDGKHWSEFITCRSDVIRIISAHLARPEEVAIWES